MLLNLIIALRHLKFHKVNSAGKIISLAGGIAFALLAIVWIGDESEMSGLDDNAPVLYRLARGEYGKIEERPFILVRNISKKKAAEIENQYTGKFQTGIFSERITVRVDYSGKKFFEHQFFLADSILAGMLAIDCVKGEIPSNFDSVPALLMNYSTAQRYFKEEQIAKYWNPIGNRVLLNIKDEASLAGIAEPNKPFSYIDFDFFASISFLEEIENTIGRDISLNALLSPIPGIKPEVFAEYIEKELAQEKNKATVEIISLKFRISGGRSSKYDPYKLLPLPLIKAFNDEDKTLQHLTGIHFPGEVHAATRNGEFFTDKIAFSCAGLFDVFDIRFVKGNKEEFLRESNSILITDEQADMQFGNKDPIGEKIYLSGYGDFRISGIINKLPPYNQIQPDYICNISYLEDRPAFNSWNSYIAEAFVTLPQYINHYDFNRSISGFFRRKAPKTDAFIHVEPVFEHHSFTSSGGTKRNRGDMNYIIVFMLISGMLICGGGINYINLSTAQQTTRAKEIGIRKTYGASRRSVFIQYMTESFLFAFFSMFAGIILSLILLPLLNGITGKNIPLTIVFDPMILIILVPVFLLTGALSGFYPAMYLSSFRPMNMLRGNVRIGGKSNVLRKFIVSIQFALSISLIIFTLISKDQLQHLRNVKKTYQNKKHIIIPRPDKPELQILRENLSEYDEIKDVDPQGNNIFDTLKLLDNKLVIELGNENIPNTIEILKKIWSESVTNIDFNYKFMSKSFEKEFGREESMTALFNFAVVISLIISVIAFYSLSVFLTRQRRRELSIRKVFGASAVNVYFLVTKEFLIVTLLANLMAWPLAYAPAHIWLRRFIYRTDIDLSIFIGSLIISFVIALSAVSYQTIKIANQNPADNLREE